jgi:hypothetical protein
MHAENGPPRGSVEHLKAKSVRVSKFRSVGWFNHLNFSTQLLQLISESMTGTRGNTIKHCATEPRGGLTRSHSLTDHHTRQAQISTASSRTQKVSSATFRGHRHRVLVPRAAAPLTGVAGDA